ncbi:MAG: DUF86 domain-containing protein [Planctomycetota bacterium]|nr:DUF86 domain-containing protein [Planctomycetota bacterium]
MKSDKTYLRHISDAIQTIESYISGVDFETFSQNSMMSDAVFRQIEIIGAAASKLSTEFQKNHPDVPVHKVKSMRNILIHEYFGVNKKTVWDTCKDDLPTLKPPIQKALDKSPP